AFGLNDIAGNEIAIAHKFHDFLERAQSATTEDTSYSRRLTREKQQLARVLLRDLKRMMNLRFCLADCTGPYALQRMAEALYMLEAEILGRPLHIPRRMALLAIGEPIDIHDSLGEYKKDRHEVIEHV